MAHYNLINIGCICSFESKIKNKNNAFYKDIAARLDD